MSVSFCDWRRLLLPLLGVGLVVGSSAGQVPKTIAFQGLLTNDQGVVLPSGDYGITFRLYNVPTDGAALWTEVQSVTVTDGVANATLGRINPLTLPFNVPYWLGITLQQEGTELSPRIALASGPYALMAQSIPDGSVTSDKLAEGAVTTDKIQDGGLEGGAIADGAITPGKLADGAITAVKIADDAVGTGAIIDGSVTSDDLADGAVDADAIADGAVTPVKVSTEGATNGQALVFDGSSLIWGSPSGTGVISEIVAGDGLTGGGDEGVVTVSVDADALTADFIAEDAIGNSELAVDAVDTENLVNGSVTGAKVNSASAASGDVLTYNGTSVVWAPTTVADNAVTTAKLADDAVTNVKISVDAVDTDQLVDNAVTTAKLDAGAVTTAKLADNGVTPSKINASTASTDDVLHYTGTNVAWGPLSVADGSIGTDQLADLAVTTDKLANSSVTSGKLGALSVGTSQVADGAITNSKIGGLINLEKLSTVGANEGDVVTFSGGVVTWAAGPVLGTTTGNVRIDGDLSVTGSVEKGGGTFKIDHPLHPKDEYLYHSFVESDEMMNVYAGNVTLSDDGSAWVQLPDWFEALNKDFRYQLTCVGAYAPVYVSDPVGGGRFRIAGGKPGLQVSWQITGVRNDPWAQKNRMKVEVDKQGAERGTLLHPEVYEQ